MNPKIFVLILFSVSFSALAQITMKRGVSAPEIQQTLAEPVAAIIAFAGNGYIVAGLFLYGVSAILWLFVLARLDVSLAYPFVALGFVLTMVLGATLLGEQIGAMRVAGTLLVGIGVAFLAQS